MKIGIIGSKGAMGSFIQEFAQNRGWGVYLL